MRWRTPAPDGRQPPEAVKRSPCSSCKRLDDLLATFKLNVFSGVTFFAEFKVAVLFLPVKPKMPQALGAMKLGGHVGAALEDLIGLASKRPFEYLECS